MIYGYCRISTMKQRLERQINNIKRLYPDAVIFSEQYTGTKIDRPEWSKLQKILKEGDTVIFDEVSRMSRNAEEGFKLYQELFNKGVNLVFIKEPHINTEVYKKAMESEGVKMTGTDVDIILKAVNEYLMKLAKNQIEIAFKNAQSEVDYLHQRTKEGIARAKANGKQIGAIKGQKNTTKKSIAAKKEILKHSQDFNGTLNDVDCMKMTGLARNTYYKYKRELKETM